MVTIDFKTFQERLSLLENISSDLSKQDAFEKFQLEDKKLTKENEQIIPYKGYCATKPDIFVALGYEKVYIEKYDTSCPANYYEFSVATNYSIRPDGRLVNNNQSTDGYFEGRITELTATKFRVVYVEPSELNSHVSEPGQINKYISILYTRLP